MERNDCFQEDEIDIFEILFTIFRYKFVILTIVILVGALTIRKSMSQPIVYNADATFFCIKNISNTTASSGNNMVTEDLVIAVLRSRMVIDEIIKQFKLVDVLKTGSIGNVRGFLYGATSITVGKGNIIKIQVKMTDPELAANITNAYMDRIEEFNRKLQLSVNASIIQIIDRAVVPEQRLPRNTRKKAMIAMFATFFVMCFLVIIVDSFKKNNVFERFKNVK